MMKNPHPARRRVYMLLGFFGAFLLLFFAVLYDAQTLSTQQQTQVRTNINALGKTEKAASATSAS